MKIIAGGDWHAGLVVGGYDAHEDLFGKDGVVWQMVEAAKDADLMVVTGDVFNCSRPEPRENAAVIDALQEVKCSLVVIKGNHDEAAGLKVDALAPLRVIRQWPQPTAKVLERYFVNQPAIMNHFGPVLAFLPYENDSKAKAREGRTAEEVVRHFFEVDVPKSGAQVVFTHHDVDGAIVGTEGAVMRGKRLALPKEAQSLDCKIVNGHMHTRQRIGNIWMPGSIVVTNMNEREDCKGYMVLEV